MKLGGFFPFEYLLKEGKVPEIHIVRNSTNHRFLTTAASVGGVGGVICHRFLPPPRPSPFSLSTKVLFCESAEKRDIRFFAVVD